MARAAFVSLCMIARNEERYLARALESARPLADELIVVDTGSTDRTVEIARSHGARVFHFEWIGDFAAARNASLRPAAGEWVVVLDADEYFAPGHAERLRRMLEEAPATVSAFQVYQTNLADEEGSRIIDKSTTIRAFRNRAHHRYQYPIHEQIVDSLRDGTIEPSDIELMHSGFIQRVSDDRGKAERNRTMLERFLADLPPEHPHRSYVHMQLGTEYRRIGDAATALVHLSQALERLEQIVAVPPNRAFATILVGHYVTLSIQAGRVDQALGAAERALAAGLDAPSVWFARGWARAEGGQVAEGVRDLLWSIALAENATGREEFVSDADMEKAWYLATQSLLRVGALGAAAAIVIHALRAAPESQMFLGLATAMGEVEGGGLRPFVVERCPEASLAALGRLAACEGRAETAALAGARLAALGQAAAVVGVAQALLGQSQVRHALPLLAAAHADERTRAEVAGAWAVFLAMMGRPLEERLAALQGEPDPERRAVFAEMVGGPRAPRRTDPSVYDGCRATLERFALAAEQQALGGATPQEETA